MHHDTSFSGRFRAMRVLTTLPGRRSRRARIAAAAVIAVALGATTAPVDAHDGDHDHGTSESTTTACPPAKAKALEKAGDNFAKGCLPGEDIARLDDSDAALEPGRDREQQEHRADRQHPQAGRLRQRAAAQQRPGLPGRLRLRRQLRRLHRSTTSANPKKPTVVSPGGLPRLARTTSRSTATCSFSAVDSSPQRRLLRQHVAAGRRSRSRGRASGSSTSATRPNPKYVTAVETDCGSHTHTLVPGKDGKDVYVYVSSYSPNATFPDCQPPHDKISIVKVPLRGTRASAAVVGTPVLFPDGGNPASRAATLARPAGCHDITAYPEKDIAAGACMGDGILLDISDRENPVVTEQVRDTTNFAFWHSATFNNAGTKVVFTDELGGGGAATCNPTIGPDQGADGDLRHRRTASSAVQELLQDPAAPGRHRELRGPQRLADPGQGQGHHGPGLVPGRRLGLGLHRLRATRRRSPTSSAARSRPTGSSVGGSWSAYYYNGYIYSNDIQQGLRRVRPA